MASPIKPIIQFGLASYQSALNKVSYVIERKAYVYMLTLTGLSENAKIAARCLKYKVHKCETLKIEKLLRQEVSGSS